MASPSSPTLATLSAPRYSGGELPVVSHPSGEGLLGRGFCFGGGRTGDHVVPPCFVFSHGVAVSSPGTAPLSGGCALRGARGPTAVRRGRLPSCRPTGRPQRPERGERPGVRAWPIDITTYDLQSGTVDSRQGGAHAM